VNIGGANTSPVVSKTNSNPFQCSILLGNRHRAIRSATLKNAQIPAGFFNIRPPYNTLTIGTTVYTVPQNNYTLTSLLATLTTLTTSLGSTGFANYANNFVSFAQTSSSNPVVVPNSFGIAQILGFSSSQILSGSTVYSRYPAFVNFDTYFNIFIENIGQSSLEPSQITYKIPLNTNTSNVIYWNENTHFSQTVKVTDRNARIDRLNVSVTDRFGNIVDNNGLDWAFTLEVESDT